MKNIVRLDKRGHLCIPITREKYEIVSNLSLDIGLKDFNRLKQGRWDRFFSALEKGKPISRLDWNMFYYYLGDVIFFQVEKEAFKEKWDLLKICIVTYMPHSKCFDIEIDCLRRGRK